MYIILYLLVSSADNLCKQFEPRPGPTKLRARSGSKLFDTLMVFLKEFFEKVDFEKSQRTTKEPEKLPRMQRDKYDDFSIVVQYSCIYMYKATAVCLFCQTDFPIIAFQIGKIPFFNEK